METMTVRQVLEITMNNLGNIAVPRALNQLIGIPIDQAIGNLQACIEAMDAQEAKAREEATQEAAQTDEEGQLSDEQEALLRHARECFGTGTEEQE